ncbi:unnamed protein product [Trichobilharzia regenti]|nr:unnamed protein product [Trichobilharzia regenti]
METYHTVWQSVNGTPFDTKTEITDTARGVFTVRLPIPYESVNSGNETIIGYFVGKDPIYTPYWTRMTEPTIVDTEAGESEL